MSARQFFMWCKEMGLVKPESGERRQNLMVKVWGADKVCFQGGVRIEKKALKVTNENKCV